MVGHSPELMLRLTSFQVLIPSAVISAGLVFAMLGATTVGGVVAFGICYGFFTGGGDLLSYVDAITILTLIISSDFRYHACHCRFCYT